MPALIALVEDDESLRELVHRLFTSRGYDVLSFGSLEKARDAVETQRPDLLLTDVGLPDGSGLELVGKFNDRTGRKVPTVVLSARSREADFARGFAAGAVDYLSKPFSAEELLAKCAVHLSRTSFGASRDADALPFEGGLTFGRYSIERELGRGGFGRVFLARDRAQGGAPVALKVLVAPACEREESRLRFLRETYTLASLADPYVVRVLDVGAVRGWNYIAMEHVVGESLAKRVVARGRIGETDARVLALGLFSALVALERAGIVHRDIKPENLILRANRIGAPVLIDFGLAKRPIDRGVTDENIIVGTPAYIPPEALQGQPIDHRSDLYGAGLTLRYALLGEEIYPELDGFELLKAIASGPLPRVTMPLSTGFAALLEELTSFDPGARPRSAERALRAVEALPRPIGICPGDRSPTPSSS